MVLVFILAKALIQDISDIHVGNCLTFPELQSALGVERTDLYQAGDCNKTYDADGKLDQDLACGLKLDTGEWHRQLVKDSLPGFYPFGGAPCYEAVQFLSYDRTIYSEVESGLACTKENAKVLTYQQEKLETKRYGVVSGAAYLPNPLWVHREIFGNDEHGQYVRLSCTESELTASYEGWGTFKAKWTEKECGSDKVSRCKEADLSASTNDKGQTCGLIDKLTDCKN